MLTATTSGGSTAAAIGGPDVGPINGAHLPQGVPVVLPPSPQSASDVWDLYNTWVYVPAGTTLTISTFN